MDFEEQTPNRFSGTIRYVAIAVVLVLLLLLGVYASKTIIASMTDKNTSKTPVATEKPEKTETSGKSEEQKNTEQEDAAKKKQEEQAAAEKAAQQQAVASTGPSNVASTGPVDTALYTLAIAALGYGVATYLRSRQTQE